MLRYEIQTAKLTQEPEKSETGKVNLSITLLNIYWGMKFYHN